MNPNKKQKTKGIKKPVFLSIKTKFFGVYCLLLAAIVIVVAMLLPMIFNMYFISEKSNELSKVRSIVSDIVKESDFQQDPVTTKLLENTAQAADIVIWICIEQSDGSIGIYVFGKTANSISPVDFNNFTQAEKERVIHVLDGAQTGKLISAFPSAFKGRTLSTGYRQEYLVASDMAFGSLTMTIKSYKQGAVFLNVSMGDIDLMSNTLQKVVFGILVLITLTAVLMLWIMGSNVLTPVKQMTQAAQAISKGDFSQEVEVRSNDEIGQLEQAFNTMAKELQSVDTLQSDFIANISHDFRSPLTSIKGYVEAMLDGTIPQELFPKYLKVVLDEANRLTKMTNNVLDLTKMENGQIEMHIRPFDINESIVSIALTFEQRVNEKKIKMNFQFLQEKLYVSADPDLIERVIYNLLDNALKFTDEGDSITVETSIVGRKAYITVSDTGSGIDENALPHIFERFNKGDKSRGKNKMGTGLGLAIVKQIMLQHHEDITVYSKVGEGTKFTFTLPLAPKSAVTSAAASAVSAQAASAAVASEESLEAESKPDDPAEKN